MAREDPPPTPSTAPPQWEHWVLLALAAIVFFFPIRAGDLPGYDDASYAHMAKGVAESGDWLHIHSNGYPALEHPPLFVWMQAASFLLLGTGDYAAKLPSALCGFLTVVLVWWLGRRLLSEWHATVAILAMAGSIYFVKYAARGMTDVPVTFFFAAAICCWVLSKESESWLLAAGLCVGAALMTRGLVGLGLPAIFFLDAMLTRRAVSLRFSIPAAVLAFTPITLWYLNVYIANEAAFVGVHSAWLSRQVFGALEPAWRRYTGVFEYLWMLVKSYWPWLPFTVLGAIMAVRRGEKRLWVLLAWAAVLLLLCGATRSRVLRYMLPAYPAFAILASVGILRMVSPAWIRRASRFAIPVLAAGVIAVAAFPPERQHAAVIRPIAAAATNATLPGERVAFYDAGQPRFDETNLMQWYGGRNLEILLHPGELEDALANSSLRVFVLDRESFASKVHRAYPYKMLAESGHLVCVRIQRVAMPSRNARAPE